MTAITPCLRLAVLLAVAAPALAQTRGPFEVKSGMYQHAEGATRTTIYFDDFGLKQATFTTSGGRLPGLEVDLPVTHQVEITLGDGTQYQIDLDQKTGIAMKLPTGAAAAAMGAALAPALTRDATVKGLPSRQVLGKECVGKEITLASMRMVTRSWTWKGIPLRTEIGSSEGGGKPMVVEASSVSAGPVPPEKFQVPAGVIVQGR